MTQFRKIAFGAVAAAGLALATSAVFAHASGADGMRGPGGKGGAHAGMGHHGGMGGKGGHAGQGPRGGGAGAAQQLMSDAERDALREKMRAAKTPEERQTLASAHRAELEKRAKEKGITLPERQGPRGGQGGHGGRGHRH